MVPRARLRLCAGRVCGTPGVRSGRHLAASGDRQHIHKWLSYWGTHSENRPHEKNPRACLQSWVAPCLPLATYSHYRTNNTNSIAWHGSAGYKAFLSVAMCVCVCG
jgi:hypothetical protein